MIKIIAFGKPEPQGSKRMVGRTKKRVPILVESCKGLEHWRSSVEAAGMEAMNRARLKPFDGPLVARFVFTMPRSEKAKGRRRPHTPPDIDKLIRSTCDALKKGGVITDDSRIVEVTRLAKVYAQADPEALISPGVRLEIGPLPEDSP